LLPSFSVPVMVSARAALIVAASELMTVPSAA
jgi:hypothetical protein